MSNKTIFIRGTIALMALILVTYTLYFFIWPSIMIHSNYEMNYSELVGKLFQSDTISQTYEFKEDNYCVDSNFDSYEVEIANGRISLDEEETFIIINSTTLFYIEESLIFVGVMNA